MKARCRFECKHGWKLEWCINDWNILQCENRSRDRLDRSVGGDGGADSPWRALRPGAPPSIRFAGRGGGGAPFTAENYKPYTNKNLHNNSFRFRLTVIYTAIVVSELFLPKIKPPSEGHRSTTNIHQIDWKIEKKNQR